MLKCPNHELPKEIILTIFYARLSHQDRQMLDASSSGVFQTRSIEEKWDLIERIQKNTEDWEIDKGIESAINYEHDYIESYVETDYFNTFCSKIVLDSQLILLGRRRVNIINLSRSHLLRLMLLILFYLQLCMNSLLIPQG